MSRPRFLADHDLNEHIVTGVLRREPLVEFVRVRDVGYNKRPDAEVLEYATSEGLVIVSHHARGGLRTAEKRIRRDRTPDGPADRSGGPDHQGSPVDLVGQRGGGVAGASPVSSTVKFQRWGRQSAGKEGVADEPIAPETASRAGCRCNVGSAV